MTVTFTIPGEPVSKGRPRATTINGFVRTYTPEKTASYENLVKLCYRQQCGSKRFGDKDALCMAVSAFFQMPKSVSKKKREGMLNGIIKPVKKPDSDNLAKIIADSINGIAYHDDSQISDISVIKRYALEPRVEVMITEA